MKAQGCGGREGRYNSTMTLNRLLIVIGVVVLLVTVGAVWLWQYAYSPEGRARTILTQLRRESTGPRVWMVQHGLTQSQIEAPEVRGLRVQDMAITVKGTTMMVDDLTLTPDDASSLNLSLSIRWKDATGNVRGTMTGDAASQPGHPAIPAGRTTALLNLLPKGRWNSRTDPAAEQILGMFGMSVISALSERIVEKWARLGPDALPVLAEAMNDEDDCVRVVAIAACGKMRDARAVGPLAQCLGEPNDVLIRACGIRSLAQIGGERALRDYRHGER